MEQLDTAIVGAGPAGISAALNAKIRGLSFVLFGSPDHSGKVARSEQIQNYPGFPNVSGQQLTQAFARQLENMDIAVTKERVTSVYNMGNSFMLLADEQKEYTAKTVILAMGMNAAVQLPGEKDFLGRGVSYCATCDGNLYRGKTIAVVCDTPAMETEVEFLAGLAGKMYYLPLFQTSQFQRPNVERLSAKIRKITGDSRVTGLELTDGSSLPVDGIFFLKQALPPMALLQGLKMQDRHIAVDRQMRTNVSGCFAAGDCTGRPYQIAKAVGEGNTALHAVLEDLAGRG
ncbi:MULTISPECIES: NAD(P)/FAD-dependent oxidoreductase [Caproicibacterium]|jgi:thioredoxin reductase (NADPH)|uniref:Thioredoxin reductase n=1 Tax=Caproicibacterium lactatifermentans TaxID=2666138 RepID=A0A859DRW6_9FIRM|nr:FAD-dependent oxidoreductase [Caproicibacterium lactatifermentans]ARP50734.1 thioredoxin reductase [Ruminococcaceae bacterium CPB6]MDD4807025.1 FAD-dependent oxidoreductase [Oscillospiraceae bacterium]QKN23532.1 thioredoxin reductase [Caproicibacterium lactatifermentans]QKO29789.1 thioredoxin reductase [Caproicibacterium lactatifermentans]